jgi:hypothetical protein
MTGLVTEPQSISTAASDVENISSAIHSAKTAAAGPTTSVVAAAEDEVSAAAAKLFGSFGQEYQALLSQANVFHEEFVAALGAAANAYAQAEGDAAGTLASIFGKGAAAPAVATTFTAADPPVQAILIMTGSGTALPSPAYLNAVYSRYLTNFVGPLQAIATAEGLYPFTGTKDLTLDISLARGVSELDYAINQAIQPGVFNLATGQGTLAVLGYSQSSIIASMEMPKLVLEGFTPQQINFTLLGDPSAPNGGLFARFPGLSLPSLGVTFGTSTPSNLFPTTIYTLEYDGFADFPRYPIDIFSDLNALAGIIYVHGTYPTLTAAQIASGTLMPGSAALGTPNSMTNYVMIPTANLPLLEPLRALPVIGNPLADLIQPELRPIVNWGYGDPAFGYSTAPANIQTPFGFLPPLSATTALVPDVIGAIPQGISAFSNDLAHLSLPSLPGLGGGGGTGGLPLPTSFPSFPQIISDIQSANTNIIGRLTTDVSTAYATLLPTADIATALAISLPSYDVNLFLNGISQAFSGDVIGGLTNAIGQPIAADVGLVTLAGGFELIAIENSLTTIVSGTPHPGPF